MMRGYKVTNRNRTKLVGVACSSLKQLIVKGGEKLDLRDELIVALDDGTVVDDENYFQMLPAQTIFILYKKDEEVVTGVDFILNVLRLFNTSYLKTGSQANEFVLKKANELMDILKKGENKEEEKVLKNTVEEDPDWFRDLDTNAQSKDQYMFRKSQDRIRGYFYKFQEDVRKNHNFLSDPHFRKISQNCLDFLKKRLKSDEYFGCYFDRRCAAKSSDWVDSTMKVKEGSTRKKFKKEHNENTDKKNFSLTYDKFSYCDKSGRFICQGKWKFDKCEFSNGHEINPYLSKEARILFSTWNLDHRIERSRSVAPTLVKTIQACGESQSVNFLYFYQLLFTKLNLKLVHVVCHDKSVHDVFCDPRFLYM